MLGDTRSVLHSPSESPGAETQRPRPPRPMFPHPTMERDAQHLTRVLAKAGPKRPPVPNPERTEKQKALEHTAFRGQQGARGGQ